MSWLRSAWIHSSCRSAMKPPMLTSASFFALIIAPSASEKVSSAMPRLALLDEVAVLGEPAGVDHEPDPVALVDRRDAFQVLERDRLAAARVVGDGHHPDRDPRPVLLAERVETGEVDVALERMAAGRIAAFGDDQIDRLA